MCHAVLHDEVWPNARKEHHAEELHGYGLALLHAWHKSTSLSAKGIRASR